MRISLLLSAPLHTPYPRNFFIFWKILFYVLLGRPGGIRVEGEGWKAEKMALITVHPIVYAISLQPLNLSKYAIIWHTGVKAWDMDMYFSFFKHFGLSSR